MKLFNFSLTAVFLSASLVFAANTMSQKHDAIPHYDLEMTGAEYSLFLEKNKEALETNATALSLQDILDVGKRNLDWLKLLNSNRTNKLSFSSAATQKGYPMDQPREYNPSIIRQQFVELKSQMPVALGQVIFGANALPATLPTTDDEYIEWGLKTDRVYQIATRWLMMEPYLSHLRSRRADDIRGFYFLSEMQNRKDKLNDFKNLPTNEQEQLREWLFQVCLNSRSAKTTCRNEIAQSEKKNALESLFLSYKPYGQKIWDKMMKIPASGRFPDVRWVSGAEVRIPFRPVSDPAISQYLVSNLEEEWKAPGVQLFVDFNLASSYSVFVTWTPGVTPHVPYLGASEMVMDANAPITEYDVQWTIRHEFGHVLGFPDCYIEFYNDDTQSIISYQLDITDLMCSRRGHLNQRHVSEMEKNYSKP